MIALYCITVSGLLLSMQHRAQRKYDEQFKLSPSQLEKTLDAENQRLDCELASLLAEHRRLAQGSRIMPRDLLVTPELRRRFEELESEGREGLEDGEE